MGALFSTPKTPKVTAPPPAPTIDDAAAAADQADRVRRRRGAGATTLAGAQGVTTPAASIGKAILLGQAGAASGRA
ncbi:hypothetical protein [Zavarzinia aquatilis]|uniref:Uncharacterized protein n=1 Tax=Zavarzinia aquatilis TaxID=2211142 RepID=A0A317EFA1_9PROT|nr:hypothetical protein [Zavarzinia aquatilis]PWR24974.1 hypothetical protein DKG74_04185 [Zavarzinia aquatilis]